MSEFFVAAARRLAGTISHYHRCGLELDLQEGSSESMIGPMCYQVAAFPPINSQFHTSKRAQTGQHGNNNNNMDRCMTIPLATTGIRQGLPQGWPLLQDDAGFHPTFANHVRGVPRRPFSGPSCCASHTHRRFIRKLVAAEA